MEMIGAASLLRMMPKGYEKACFETKAIIRRRDIKDPNDLMMLILFHLLTGCSLIEVSEISKLAKLGSISDVAFMKRFSNCNDWFKWILEAIRNTNKGVIKYEVPEKLKQYRILAVDASDVAEKGASGRIFRLHFALDLCHMHAALYKITKNDVGEHLRNYDISKGDLVLADRAYSSITGIEYCKKRDCRFIARMKANSFKPYDSAGKPMDLLCEMKEKDLGELNAFAKVERGENAGELIPVRICFKKKPEEALESARKKLHRKESKRQLTITPATKLFNEYIVLVTDLDKNISTSDIIELYRYRWQVELYFKRLKSILDYGELPKKSEKSIMSWLNGKLMIALLIESMMGKADFSPLTGEYEEYLAGNENDNVTLDYKSM